MSRSSRVNSPAALTSNPLATETCFAKPRPGAVTVRPELTDSDCRGRVRRTRTT